MATSPQRIQILRSVANTPASLNYGELAWVQTGNLLYIGNSTSGAVQITSSGGAATPGGANTQVQYNNSGVLGGSAALTFNSTTGTLQAQNYITGPAGFCAMSNAVIASTNNVNVNCALGNFFTVTCNGSAANIYFTSTPASGNFYSFSMSIANGGSNTISWANTPKWTSGAAPLLSGNTDLLQFYTTDGGTTWYGQVIQRDQR